MTNRHNRRQALKTAAVGVFAAAANRTCGETADVSFTDGAKVDDKQLKITDVEPLVIRGTRGYHAWQLLRIRTNQGIEGVGEGFAFAYGGLEQVRKIHGFINQLARQIVGTSPLQIEAFLQRSATLLPPGATPRYWYAAVAAIEIAMWDILGKVVDLPVYALLGGKVRNRIPLYANHGAFFTDDRSYIDVLSSSTELIQVVEATRKAGYGMFKWDPFQAGGNPGRAEIDKRIAIVSEVRDAVGTDFRIAIDAHGRFDVAGAKMAAQALEPLDIFFFEEPTNFLHPKRFRPVAESTSIPLATGEHLSTRTQVADVLRSESVHYLQPEIGNNGGIFETLPGCRNRRRLWRPTLSAQLLRSGDNPRFDARVQCDSQSHLHGVCRQWPRITMGARSHRPAQRGRGRIDDSPRWSWPGSYAE